MQGILRLEGAIQHYEWGSRTMLAALQGRAPSERPEAELWLGAHPNGQAHVVTREGARVPLAEWVARDPRGVLGDAVVARFGPRLPFLLKMLAVERALSLQAHPDAEQASRGYARERRSDFAPHARLYADAHAKLELVVAHTEFRALCGFRPLAEIQSAFERFGLVDLAPAAGAAEGEWLRAFFARWFASDAAELRDSFLHRAIAAAQHAPADDATAASVVQLAAEHPGDPGILAPLLLHVVDLAPGDALFLEAGELHCYVAGSAAEIMTSSDNVLRAGLTTKLRAADEVLAVGRFASRRPEVLRAAPRAPGVGVYAVPVAEFEFGRVEVEAAEVVTSGERSIEVLLCHSGSVRVAALGGGDSVELRSGEACLVSASAGAHRIAGTGQLYRASVPRRPAA